MSTRAYLVVIEHGEREPVPEPVTSAELVAA